MLIRFATKPFFRAVVLFLTVVLVTSAQTSVVPAIAATVNSAAYSSPIAPGSLVSIFGSNLASTTQSANTTRLPTNLGGVTVTFDGVVAPLLFVSPAQINAQVPTSIANGTGRIVVSQVVVTTAAGSSAPASVQVYSVAPAFFTQDGSGCGAAAALNVTADGGTSLNTPQHSVAPGDYITLFGTGLGVPMAPPADGAPATSPDAFVEPGVLHFDWAADSTTPSYSGLAPNLAGASQVNIQIPATMREGCAVPLSMNAGALLWASPTVTISVAKNRGQCSDPPVESYGEVILERTIAVGTTSDGAWRNIGCEYSDRAHVEGWRSGIDRASHAVRQLRFGPESSQCLVRVRRQGIAVAGGHVFRHAPKGVFLRSAHAVS
ncbi:MAG: IPT/TIG domain-containing protein [Bryobacteraceae bacterium]